MTDAALIERSGLFDPDWYAATYRDVAPSGMTPLAHFLRLGAMLHRSPGPEFSSQFHVDVHGRRKLGKTSALVHHLRHPDDPPVPELVLQAAAREFALGRVDLALALARRHLTGDLAPTVAALEANAAWLGNDAAGWQAAVNRYLAGYGQAPLALGAHPMMLGRLGCGPLPRVENGPLISVVMAVWNGEQTVELAARSILDQTWRPLELLIVDDASTDGTWPILQRLAAADPRVKLHRNRRNVGPYVCKNMAVAELRGAYLTCHDSDDWAHPERLELHIRQALAAGGAMPASTTYMLRMQEDGMFGYVSRARIASSSDGWARYAPPSCLFETGFFRSRLGHWDSVRFAADSEIIERTRHILGPRFVNLAIIAGIALERTGSLSNDPTTGTRADSGQLSPVRKAYFEAIRAKLSEENLYIPFPQDPPRYQLDDSLQVPPDAIRANLNPKIAWE